MARLDHQPARGAHPARWGCAGGRVAVREGVDLKPGGRGARLGSGVPDGVVVEVALVDYTNVQLRSGDREA